MNPSRWRRLQSAFGRMIDEESGTGGEGRRLTALLPSNPSLRSQLGKLIARYKTVDPLLDWALANSANAPLLAEGQVLISRFRIVRFLGRGGMGEVYEAVDTTLSKSVALKTLNSELQVRPEFLLRFQKEVSLAQRVTHRNICRIHDIYTHVDEGGAFGKPIQFLTMALLRGETLSEYVARRGALPFEEALEILRQLAAALESAHAEGVIHRDFKPGNIIVAEDSLGLRPTITDFGLAAVIDSNLDRNADKMAAAFTCAGTPFYAAPEQILGGWVTKSADIHAFGAVAFEMLTGAERDLDSPLLSTASREAIARCMHQDPERRFSTPSEFVRVLSENAPAVPETGFVVSRRSLLTAGLGLCVAGGLTTLIVRRTLIHNSGIRSLSVLPFDGDQGGMDGVPGLQSELVRAILGTSRINVIAPGSSGSFSKPFDFRKIASDLHADALLTGVITASSVDIQLVGHENVLLWRQRFERKDDVFALYQEIATAVMKQLDAPASNLAKSSGAVPSQAGYLAYVSGRSHMADASAEEFSKAEAFFHESIRRDARFAPAWAALAHVLTMREQWSEARQAANQALTIDDKLAEAYLVKGLVYQRGDWNWNAARQTFRKALALEPNNGRVHQWYGGFLSDIGETAQALPELAKAVELDPLSVGARTTLGICSVYAHQFDAAAKHLTQAMQMSGANGTLVGRAEPFLGYCWLMRGNRQQAYRNYEDAARVSPPDSATTIAHFVFGAARCGHHPEAKRALERLRRLPEGKQRLFYVAMALVGLGDIDGAFSQLNSAIDQRDGDVVLIKSHVYCDALRSDPRYAALTRRLGLA